MAETAHEDLRLIAQIKRGDQQAFRALYDRYWNRLYGMAANRLQSRQMAEDMVQELFTDLWNRRASLEITTSVSAYLYAMLKYLIINHIRSKSIRRKYVDIIAEYYEVNQWTTENQVLYKELAAEINQQVEKLPDRRRQIFKMSRYDQFSHQEIADKLNISYKTVETHIYKALTILRPSIDKIIGIITAIALGL